MSEDADDSQKTEDPTAKRLSEARSRGQVPKSQEVATWLMLFGAAVIIGMSAPFIMSEISKPLLFFIERPHEVVFTGRELTELMNQTIREVMAPLLIPLVAFVILAIVSSVAQFGFAFSPKALEPKLSKFNPLEGVKRLASGKQLVETLKGVLKIIMVGVIGALAILPEIERLDILATLSPHDLLKEIYVLVIRVLTGTLAFLLVVTILDVFFQRYQHVKQLKMTKQEIKEEFKNQEGDPLIKAKLRQLRMQKSRQRMMQAVPKADVVVTNPTHFSVALEYKPDQMDVPIVVAKGQDELAFRIRSIAKDNDIEIVANPPLARALYATAEVDEEIPEEHFKAVAEVISYVFSLRGRRL